jgi:hypothetical protein
MFDGDDGSGAFGGGDGWSGGWGGDRGRGDNGEGGWSYGRSDANWLWTMLCICSVIQGMHYVLTADSHAQAKGSAFAALTHSLYASQACGLKRLAAA